MLPSNDVKSFKKNEEIYYFPHQYNKYENFVINYITDTNLTYI